MKKLISLLLALVLTFSLVGCGNSDDLKAMVGSYELTGLVDPDKGDLSKQLDLYQLLVSLLLLRLRMMGLLS